MRALRTFAAGALALALTGLGAVVAAGWVP